MVPTPPTSLWPWQFLIAFARFFVDKGRRLKESDHAFGYTGLLLPGHIVVVLPGEVGESN